MKKIWIVNPQTASPEKIANPRYLELAKYFMKAGFDVTTFNSSQREEIEVPNGLFVEKKYGEYKFVHVFAPDFVGNGIKRMLSLHTFAQNVMKISGKLEKPDVVLQNIHPPFDYPVVRMVKKLNAKYIAEAWDLWPEDFVTFGLVKANNPLLKVAYQVEKQYYYHADEIVFTFEGGIDYLKRQGWTKETGGKIDLNHVHYINNGINLAQFDKDKLAYPRQDADINERNVKKIVYLGSISRANNVKMLIDAAERFKNSQDYRFFIYGDGAYRDELEQYVKDTRLDNVVFKEKQISLAECAWVVSQATVNIMNCEKNFGRFGVSAGKLFLYLAAGKPIVCNIHIAYDDVITKKNLGIARDFTSVDEYVAAIRQMAEQPQSEYEAMCQRVRQTGEEFDYEKLAQREMQLL